MQTAAMLTAGAARQTAAANGGGGDTFYFYDSNFPTATTRTELGREARNAASSSQPSRRTVAKNVQTVGGLRK